MSKLVKILLRIGVGIVQLSISLVVIISILSAGNIILNQDPTTIVDIDNASFNISDPNDCNISIPFNLDNTNGYYDFENLTIHIELGVFNVSENFTILNGTQSFTIPKNVNYTDTIAFGNSSFHWEQSLIDGLIATPSNYNLSVYIDVSAVYALGLIPFRLNITIPELPLT